MRTARLRGGRIVTPSRRPRPEGEAALGPLWRSVREGPQAPGPDRTSSLAPRCVQTRQRGPGVKRTPSGSTPESPVFTVRPVVADGTGLPPGPVAGGLETTVRHLIERLLRMSIVGRLWFISVVAVACLAVSAVISHQALERRGLEERKAKVRAT